MNNITNTTSQHCEIEFNSNKNSKIFLSNFFLMFIIASSFLLVQCNNSSTSSENEDKSAWEKAQKENTLGAYDKYLERSKDRKSP